MSIAVNGKLVPIGGGDTIPLIRESLTLGRRESCDVCLRFPNVSGQHCQLSFKDGYWYIKDLNSTNGVKVNGDRVQSKLLHPKDEITIAKRKWVIQYEVPSNLRHSMLEDAEDDLLGRSLLERAGLEKRRKNDPGGDFDDDDEWADDDD